MACFNGIKSSLKSHSAPPCNTVPYSLYTPTEYTHIHNTKTQTHTTQPLSLSNFPSVSLFNFPGKYSYIRAMGEGTAASEPYSIRYRQIEREEEQENRSASHWDLRSNYYYFIKKKERKKTEEKSSEDQGWLKAKAARIYDSIQLHLTLSLSLFWRQFSASPNSVFNFLHIFFLVL